MAGNLLVLQGGGPTPTLNASLFGVIAEAHARGFAGRILGARHGIVGVRDNDLVDLTHVDAAKLDLVKRSPGATLGTTRYKPTSDDYARVVDTMRGNDVRYTVLIGGNGSLRGAQLIHDLAIAADYELSVVGVPKTIDNDLPATDRCPGFGSAARYAAQAVRDLGMDVRALSQPVSIFETMGRNVGWLAAATVMGRIDADHAPHLVYLPERAFNVDAFLGDVDRTVRRLGWCVVTASEGLKRADGRPVFETASAAQTDALGRPVPGDVAPYLAGVVAERLKIRCRSEKPGLCGRASMLHASAQDLRDAEHVGRVGLCAALAGDSGHFVALEPIDGDEPRSFVVPLAAAAGERHVPDEWLTGDPYAPVAPAMLDYLHKCAGPLVDYAVPLSDVARATSP